MRNRMKLVGILLLITVGLILPLLISQIWIRLLTQICMYAALALSWNLISGITGYISFGHVVFFGVGAYTTAILMVQYHVSFLVSVIFAALSAFVVAIIIGAPILRSRGHYFAIATLGVAEAAKEVYGIAGIFGGGKGWSLPISQSALLVYYLLFILLFVTVFITWLLLNSRYGLGLLSIREDEDAAQALGIPTTRYKISIYALSAVLIGAIGGIYAFYISFVDSESSFSSEISLSMMVMALIGGLGTLWGPVIGAVVMILLENLLWQNLPQIHSMILGLLIMFVVLFLPNGIMPYISGKQKLTIKSFRETLKNIGI